MAAISVVIDETLPTGRYERLARASDGFGAGAYATGLSIYSQDYLWMPNGRYLRVRLELQYAISSSAGVHDVSLYGTERRFRRREYPGVSFTAVTPGGYHVSLYR